MNPFLFGKVVRGEYFADREEEIKFIRNEVESGQNLVLMSPRRYGKTSLVVNAIENMNAKCLDINMELVTGEDDLSNILIKKTLSLSPFEKLKNYLKNLRVQPDFKYEPGSGELSISLGPEKKDIPVYLEDALNLPEKVGASQKENLVIVYDEFQEIRRISPGLERKMRAILQHHQNVVYIFIGSCQRMMGDIFGSRKTPFYKFARIMNLKKIPEEKFKKFIIGRFKKKGIETNGLEDDIIKRVDNHPYYTQQLCHEICNLNSGREIRKKDINKAIGEIIVEHNADYMRWWKQADNTEKRLLIGITEGDKKYTSGNFLRKYGINSPSTSSSAFKRLVEKGFVVDLNGEIKIEDPFWEIWIRENRKQML